MYVSSIGLALPKRKVTNDAVLAMVREQSQDVFEGDLEETLVAMKRALRLTGTAVRYWLEDGQTSLEVTLDACRKAIDKLTDSTAIDLVICASVYSELTEPATANVIAHMLGLDHAEAFDMKEACDGWVKALKVARALLKTGQYRRVLVVNGEFSMVPRYAIRPDLFALPSKDALAHRFPIFTVGEGATATIIDHDPTRKWEFTNKTRNDLYDLCSVSTPWHQSGTMTDKVGKDGPGLFTSWATELSAAGIPLAVETFKESGIDPLKVDHLFTHASSTRDWKKIAGKIGLSNKLHDVHPELGNLVSASIPAAMARAEQRGVLKRGDNVAVLCASAGMTFSTIRFVH